MSNQYYTYIMTNKNNTVLYTGITNSLKRRVHEHKQGSGSTFAKKYKVVKLVYCEIFDDSYNAIVREKQIKGGSRQKKLDLIISMNPCWDDLYQSL